MNRETFLQSIDRRARERVNRERNTPTAHAEDMTALSGYLADLHHLLAAYRNGRRDVVLLQLLRVLRNIATARGWNLSDTTSADLETALARLSAQANAEGWTL